MNAFTEVSVEKTELLTPSTWYFNFLASVQADFPWAGFQMKPQKPQNPYIQVVMKKGFPMVFPGMHTVQLQWRN